MNEFDFPDFNQDEALGIPSELSQRAMLGEAVYKAQRINRELLDQVDGMLSDYVRFALEEASGAAAALITIHPKDDRMLFELQKRAAPYASVMDWIRERLREGSDAQQQLNTIEERSNGQEQ